MGEWQPIETAPDNQLLLFVRDKRRSIVAGWKISWRKPAYYMTVEGFWIDDATHWLAIPIPPALIEPPPPPIVKHTDRGRE